MQRSWSSHHAGHGAFQWHNEKKKTTNKRGGYKISIIYCYLIVLIHIFVQGTNFFERIE